MKLGLEKLEGRGYRVVKIS